MSYSERNLELLQADLDICAQLTSLEEKTEHLEKDFGSILSAAKDLAGVVKRYVDKAEIERQSWDLLDTLLESGCTARDVLDHVKIFFNFLLAKMTSRRADVTDVKMLWHLVDKEGVQESYRDSLKSFGFSETNEKHIRLLLAVIYRLQVDLERETESDFDENNIENQRFNEAVEKCMQSLSSELHKEDKSVVDGDGTCMKSSALETKSNNNRANQLEGCLTPQNKAKDRSAEGGLDAKKHGTTSGDGRGVADDRDMDFTAANVKDVDSRLIDEIDSWYMDDGLRAVIKRMMAIVIYTLNYRRNGLEPLSIVNKVKICKTKEVNV